jgi:RNA polymerase sigma-70 factor (ECF subfamily)
MQRSKDKLAHEIHLISRCKAGEKEPFHPLITPYLHTIALVAYSILQNHEDAEETVQETVLKAFTHLEQLREGESFKAWLLQIATNEARMRLRKNRGRHFDSVEGQIKDREFQPRQFVEWRNIPSNELEQKELRVALMNALDGLTEAYREVLVLRDVQHLSSAETGKILGVSEAAVDTRLHRAHLQMREQLTTLFRRPTRKWIAKSVKMMALKGKRMLRIGMSCRRAMNELSNYTNEYISAELRRQIQEHLRFCDHCSVLLDTTRKVLYIVGDEEVFDLPFKCNQHWDLLVNKSAEGMRRASSA